MPDQITVLTDYDKMPFGKHEGKTMANVPAAYLIYLYDVMKVNHLGVKKYIENNMQVLRSEVAKLPKNWNR